MFDRDFGTIVETLLHDLPEPGEIRAHGPLTGCRQTDTTDDCNGPCVTQLEEKGPKKPKKKKTTKKKTTKKKTTKKKTTKKKTTRRRGQLQTAIQVESDAERLRHELERIIESRAKVRRAA